MTNAVNAIGQIQNAPQQNSANAAATSQSNSSAFDPNAKSPADSSRPPISPRIVIDPLAGVITEFLSENGEVQSQIPSTAVVAYLRAGLTAAGQVKDTPENSAHNTNSEDKAVYA